jgi:hypothetical protein
MDYKLSAATIEQIAIFLKINFEFEFEEKSNMLNQTDAFVYLGILPNEIDDKTGKVISYLDGLHFDILTDKELVLIEGISKHFPTEPKHQFTQILNLKNK